MKNIILNEFKSFLRNPYLILVLIIFPVVLVYILGSFLDEVQTADQAIGEVHLGYFISKDQEDEAEQIKAVQIRSLLENTKEKLNKANVIFEEVSLKEEGLTLLQEQQVDAYLVYEAGSLKLYEGTDVYLNHTVKCMITGMLKQMHVYEIATNSLKTSSFHFDEMQLANEKTYTVSKKLQTQMSMMDYYAIAMTIMTAFFGSIGSCMAFTDEKNSKTINRLIILPQNRFKLFAGKVVGLMPQAILQVTVIMLVSSFVYGASYGKDLASNLLLFALFAGTSVTVSAIGILLSLIFKKSMVVLLFAVNWLLLFFSGIFAMAMAIKPLCDYLPPYILNQAAIKLSLLGESQEVWCILGVELIVTMDVLVLGGIIFSKKQEERG